MILLDDLIARHRLKISGVLHVGAHLGEEAEAYQRCDIDNVVWIEGNPDLIMPLIDHVAPFGHRVIEALVDDTPRLRKFNITNNGESSSILELGTHRQTSPQVRVTHALQLYSYTLDELAAVHSFAGLNMVNIDLQGAELLALRGATNVLSGVDYIYCEVNKREVYKKCCLVDELDEFLVDFERVETLWCTDGGVDHGWGDMFAIRVRNHRERPPEGSG